LNFSTQNPSGVFVANQSDASGNFLVANGSTTRLALAAGQTLVKAAPGRVAKLIVNTATGTAGTLAVNDCASTGAVAAGNVVYSVPFGTAILGTVIVLDVPCLVGIVVTVPTSSTVTVVFD
jgi:hypothetical protein